MATKRKIGPKLNRSEIIQVRFDPKLRIAAELAAAKERRSLSSLIEWALQRAVPDVMVTTKDGRPISAAEVAETIWDTEEADRFVKLATQFPELLTYDQQRLWRAMRDVQLSTSKDGTPLRYRLFVDDRPKVRAIRKVWPRLKGMLDAHFFSLHSHADTEDFDDSLRRLLEHPIDGIEPEIDERFTLEPEEQGDGT